MLLERMNPWMTLHQMQRQMDRVLDSLYDASLQRAAYPPINVWDEGERLVVQAEVPGLRADDFEVFAQNDELTIRGTRKPLEGESLVYRRRERDSGAFERVVTLPFAVDADHIEAELKDGLLTVRLPKAESERPRKIAITSA